MALLWRLQRDLLVPTSNSKGTTQQDRNTHVTTALGFFSTAYTLTFRPDSSPAVNEARTSGPRPAPTTIITLTRKRLAVNPLCVNSDQHQFSPNNTHTLSRGMVMTIYKMITKEKMPWSFIRVKGAVSRNLLKILTTGKATKLSKTLIKLLRT